MTSCYEIEEQMNEEDDRHESALRKADKTFATLEAISMRLN